MAGSIITETIYGWPGVGRLLIDSIFHRDVPVVEAAVFYHRHCHRDQQPLLSTCCRC